MKRSLLPLLILAFVATSNLVPQSTFAQDDSISILWTQYSLAGNTLKLTAHTDLDPWIPSNCQPELKSRNSWEIVASAVEPLTAMAAFRIDNWDSDTDRIYRLFGFNANEGIIRQPDDKRVLKLMAVSCVNDNRFPYRKAVSK